MIRRLGFLVLVAACLPTAARRGQTIVMASGADLESMNALVTTHPLAKQIQRYALLTTLVQYDSSLTITPYLARRWQWSDEGRRLIMTLHGGLQWHDGAKTTARDAAWTLRTALDSTVGYPRRADLAGLTDAAALDDTTLVLRFGAAPGRIPDLLTDLAILPAHLLGTVGPAGQRAAAWNRHPIGNGPFRFVRHDPNRRWVFEANPGFPPSLGGRPRIDRLVIAVVDDPTTKLAALASGELDFAGIQPAHADFVRRDSALMVVDYPLVFSYVLLFNTQRSPFREWQVRRAIDLAIDRLAIVSGYLYGFATPASGPVPPDLTSNQRQLVYAPGRGKALLDSRPLEFELLTVGSGEAAMEQMIQQQLARIGVAVKIRQLELAAFLDRVQVARDFDAAIMGVPGDLELGHLATVFRLAGMPIAAGRHGRDLVSVMQDSVPASFLYHARGVQGIQRRVQGVRLDLRGELATLHRWTAP